MNATEQGINDFNNNTPNNEILDKPFFKLETVEQRQYWLGYLYASGRYKLEKEKLKNVRSS